MGSCPPIGTHASHRNVDYFISCKNYLAEPTNIQMNAASATFIGFLRINPLRGESDAHWKIQSHIVQGPLRDPSLTLGGSIFVNA